MGNCYTKKKTQGYQNQLNAIENKTLQKNQQSKVKVDIAQTNIMKQSKQKEQQNPNQGIGISQLIRNSDNLKQSQRNTTIRSSQKKVNKSIPSYRLKLNPIGIVRNHNQ